MESLGVNALALTWRRPLGAAAGTTWVEHAVL